VPTPEFRLFFDGTPATRAQLDDVGDLTVEQHADLAWEARATFPLRVDARGSWSGGSEPYTAPFARFRAEARTGPDEAWVALIDGPVVGNDSQRSPQPGQSTVTLLVNDDSALLNRDQAAAALEGPVNQVARTLFDHPAIARADVESPSAGAGATGGGGGGGQAPPTVQRGSPMQTLRMLAQQVDMHAYVLPGDQPGRSVGCLKTFPREVGSLPELVLLGPGRNVEELNVSANAQSPARVTSSTLNFSDKGVVTAQQSYRDLELLGEQPPPADSQGAAVIAPPAWGGVTDPTLRATAVARRSSRGVEARGALRTECYGAVMRPYEVVLVKGIDDRSSGRYVITGVTHKITRGSWRQEFTLSRDAASAGGGAATTGVGRVY